MKTVRKNKLLQKILVSEKASLNYLIDISTKKVPTEDICRKNVNISNIIGFFHRKFCK